MLIVINEWEYNFSDDCGVTIIMVLYCVTVSVESTGALASNILVLEALKILISKCDQFLGELDVIERPDQ